MKWLHEPTRSTLAGVPMLQCWSDLVLWEHVLNMQGYASLLELGTYKGAFSVFLYAQCEVRGVAFWTFDVKDLLEVPWVRHRFVQCDVLLSGEVEKRMVHPCLLYCDNGHKKTEVQKFVPLLKSGDVLGVHDWGNEIGPEDMPEGLEPLYHHEAKDLGMITRFWRV